MKRLGLIGRKLIHSFSASYFSEKFKNENISDFSYQLFPLETLSELHQLITCNADLVGFNVTTPFKQAIVNYLDELDPTAVEIGAVNTVCVFRKDNGFHLKGFNTDVYGFKGAFDFSNCNCQALILGTGGAAQAVSYALRLLGISSKFVSRNPSDKLMLGYPDLTAGHFKDFRLIINATPSGMYPDIESFPPLPYHFLQPENILYDLVYNPEITRFMKFGIEKGATVINGLKMLKLQAEASWKIWNSMDCISCR